MTRRNRSILDESCAELAPTAISYHKYSAMPMDDSGDQLVVRRISGESICELSKREPVVVFNKSLKDQVENTIWIKRHLHSSLLWVRPRHRTRCWLSNAPKRRKSQDSSSRGTLRLNSPPPSAARFLAYGEPHYIEMALMGDMLWKSAK